MRIKVRDIEVGMEIKGNVWGLSRTEGRRVLSVEQIDRGGIVVTVAGWEDRIGLSANTRIDI